jgi:high-affinity iron transporter
MSSEPVAIPEPGRQGMLAAFLITLREGIEAALIVGIVLSALRRLNRLQQASAVWMGVTAAVVASAGAGWLLNALGLAFEGRGEAIFEGVAMITAAGVLTWMIFWMRKQGRSFQTSLAADVEQASGTDGSRWALFGLAFVAVLREGIETVLFLTAAALSTGPTETLLGGSVGLIVAVGLGWLVFAAGKELSLKRFFQTTGIVLLFFAAGLLGHGIHELQEAGLLPTLVEQVWNINPVLDENSVAGSLLKALFGYNGNPSLLEVVFYSAYLLIIGRLSLGPTPTRPGPAGGLRAKSA